MGFLSHKLIYAGLECLDALGANVLAVEGHNVLRAVTEDTGRLIFLHDDIGAIDVNLETVTLCDVKSAAKLDGEDNAPQLVDFAHDTGRFHKFHPFPVRPGVPESGRRHRFLQQNLFYYKEKICQYANIHFMLIFC